MDRRTFLKALGMTAAAACTTSTRDAGAPSTTNSPNHADHGGVGTTSELFESPDVLRVSSHTVLEQSLKVPGVLIEPSGTLTFASNKDITLESTGNVLVLGKLEAHPEPNVTHRLRFVGVDESKFVGGGMEPLDSDVGMWVMGAGMLDLVGASKVPWSYDPIQPSWAPTDEIVIAPTEVGDFDGFQIVPAGQLVSHNPRPVGPGWRPELLNLTRNLHIEGAPDQRAHIFIRSSSAQTVRFASLSYLGPTAVLGRYPLHFHHAEDGSRGSLVEGVVTRHCGKHAFVPHMSHGVTFMGCIAYDTIEEAFWWDEGDETHDMVWENCVAAHVRIGERAHRLSGFFLGAGLGTQVRDCVAVGVEGGSGTGGFAWPSRVRTGEWVFQGNIAHNNRGNGLWVWQNGRSSLVEDFAVYRNGIYGISHGAYNNEFVYRDGHLFGNGEASVQFTALGVRFENLLLDGDGITQAGVLTGRHPAPGKEPAVFANCQITGHTNAKVLIAEGVANKNAATYDFINCQITEDDVVIQGEPALGIVLRGQNGNEAFSVDSRGNVSSIEPFADQTVSGYQSSG